MLLRELALGCVPGHAPLFLPKNSPELPRVSGRVHALWIGINPERILGPAHRLHGARAHLPGSDEKWMGTAKVIGTGTGGPLGPMSDENENGKGKDR